MYCYSRCKNEEKGFALVLVIVVLMTLSVLGVGVMISTGTNNALSRNFEKSTQALNMAELGARVAYREIINCGYLKTTHTMNMEARQTGEQLLDTSLQNYTIDADGYFVWEWDSGKGYDPMWETDVPHGFRFCVYYNTDDSFVIETEGWYDKIHRRIRAKGELEGMFQFSYFSAIDLTEFARAATQTITGKVHANGNLYLCPSGGTTRFNSSSVTATGLIVRSRDVFNRPDTGGTMEITQNAQDSGIWVEMAPGNPRGSEGVAFESKNPNWNDQINGASALWEGVVRDKVPYKSPPPVENLEPGRYYDTQADLHITNASHGMFGWCAESTFYNFAEQMFHTVKDIDVGAMIAAGDWPANGLIYCSTMVRFLNAEELDNRLMVASNSTIYTHGNFNTINRRGAALMTIHRVYILSGVWDDNHPDVDETNRPPAIDTTINAAIVDGIPAVNAYNYVDRDEDGRYDDSGNDIYDDWDDKTAATHHYPPDQNDPWGPIDDLLEDWGSGARTLTKFGATVHLGGAEMAQNLDNAGIQPDQLAWVQRRGYWWPTRNYTFDPDLATPAGQPPFTPLIGHITSWEPF